MMLRQKIVERLLIGCVAFVLITLAACGGGGGGGGNGAGSNSSPGASPGPGAQPAVPASGWGSAQQLGTLRNTFYTEIYNASVAVNNANRALVAWVEDVDCGGRLWTAQFDGTQWASAVDHDAIGAAEQNVAINDAGNAVVVWRKNYYDAPPTCGGISGSEIWIRRQVAGTWQASERVSNASGQTYSFWAFDPVVTMDAANRITVAWSETTSGSGNQATYVRRFQNAVWSAATRISAADRYSWEVRAGVDDAGNVTVIWRQDTNAFDPSLPAGGPLHPAMWAARYDAASEAWTPAQRIGSLDFTTNSDSESRPHLSVSSSGHVGAIWERVKDGGPNPSIYMTRFDPNASAWSTPVAVESSANAAYWPQIAVDPSGTMQAVWAQTDVGITNLYTARRDATSGAWGASILLETNDNDIEPPSVAIDANGRALAVWSQPNGSSHVLYARHLNAAGAEALVPIGYGRDQSLAVNAGGFAVVAQPKITYSSTAFLVSAYATLYVP